MNVLLLENKNIFLSNAKYFFKKNNINIFIKNNIETYDKFKNFCETNNITHLIYDFRKSYGKNIWNTSYIENKLEENLQYNLIYPLKIANYCKKLNIHFTYIGEGWIFNNSESKKPDLKVSNHSLMNIYCEEILNYLFEDILYLRVRYPITGNFHPGCHIMKLISYENIIECL